MARFTGTIPLFFNVPATAARLGRRRDIPRRLAAAVCQARRLSWHQLGGSDRRRRVFAGKKGGSEVGNTKRGKGTKSMLMVDGNGLPLSAFTLSANEAEVNAIETLVDFRTCEQAPERLLYDQSGRFNAFRHVILHIVDDRIHGIRLDIVKRIRFEKA
jgi:hypothetical protein